MQPANNFIIQDVRIFTGDEIIQEGFVVVKGGLIEDFGSGVPHGVHAGVPVLRWPGCTILPGLIDAHIHALEGNISSLEQSLRFGVTTVCDMHNSPGDNGKLKKLAEDPRNADRYSDFKCAGMGAVIPGGWPIPVLQKEYSREPGGDAVADKIIDALPKLRKAEDAEPYVKQQVLENGASYIKMFHELGETVGLDLPEPDMELQRAVVAAAHRMGVIAVGHAFSYKGAVALLRAGADGLTHIFCDEPPSDDYIALMKATGAHCNPTLGLVASQTDEDQEVQKWFLEDPLAQRMLLDKSQCKPMGLAAGRKPKASIKHAYANTNALYRAGVPIVAGTDAAGRGLGTSYGLGLHQELHLLVHRAGLSAVDALKAATSVPADRFGFNDRGRIQVGRKADLVMIEGDVVAALENKDNRCLPITAVWRNGVSAIAYQ